MRKALIVGIDHYDHIGSLSGCVNDAYAVKSVLERHADGTVNFANPRIMIGAGGSAAVRKSKLKEAARELFAGDADIALFYFAGHGFIEDTGGFICATDCETGDDGFSLHELMSLATQSRARNKVVILDSCHSGVAGDRGGGQPVAEVGEGMTVLTASTAEQYASEIEGGGAGVFTTLLVDALGGAAANLVGEVTPGSIYAHIDQSLGPWAQRPVFKTNVKTFVSLRKAEPPIPLADLQALDTHFPRAAYDFPLDPAYEPERSEDQKLDPGIPAPDPAKTAVFALLQRFVKVNLVRPVGATHMWHAAMQGKSCELTVLGEHYRKLVASGLI
ncbi:caspase domain-containing protein [Methylobacterium sp. J-092]|uniref:caspase family protein n=1 Tax=Methylobacterium sp. J-092 TaxID=2836667 RepID=UPI001FBBE400|nr:caspase family protein [Methylobacterium sp. J-092]MCJ2007033.1 caspase family protein [Methylobacterium sp. J-092]